jgi:hypothetical protein
MSLDSIEKTCELIVYIAERSKDDPRFDRMKLAKLLFFCDFSAHAELGAAITGASYRKQAHGPLADAQLLAEQTLSKAGAIELRSVGPTMYRQTLVVAKREADISWLSAKQRAIIDEVVNRHRGNDAMEMRTLSHAFPGCELAAEGDPIPYHSVYVSREGPTQADIDWARSVAEGRGDL